MIITRFVLLSIFFGLFIHQTNSQKYPIENESIDSILNWIIAHETTDSIQIHKIGLRALSRARESGDLLITGQLHQALAAWIDYHGLIPQDSVVYHDRRALDYYSRLNDSLKMAGMYQILAIDEMNLGLFVEARESVFNAISLFEKMNNKDGLANAYRSLANLHTFTKEPESAIKYAKLAMEHYRNIEDYYRMAITYLPLMLSYKELDSLILAHEAADQCISIVDNHLSEGRFIKARALSNKSDTFIQQNQLDSALSYANQSYDLVAEAVGRQRASSYSEPIAEIHLMKGQYKEALSYFLPIIATADDQNIENLYLTYEKISICYENIGDYQNALVFQRRSAETRHEIDEKKIENLESQAFIKYETRLKDQEIAAQQVEIKQNTQIQSFGMAFLLLLSGFFFFLIRLYLKNQKITKSLKLKNEENEFLLKEIHHRVKNNLQILSSLLSLQSNYILDQQASDAIREGRNRVESMGMIHQRLYQGVNKMAIDLNEYISDLCNYLTDSFLLESQNITISSDVTIGNVDVETAIPLGLVVNELITNSVKYAFNSQNGGRIEIMLWINDAKQMCLTVKDNGQGKQNHLSGQKGTSNFGTDLVNVLIKKLRGTLIRKTENGFATHITFDRFKLVG